MRLSSLTLRHFRNVALATISFRGRQTFFVGRNGQGKTNLIEAAGFLTALRSFRTSDNRLLIGHGQPSAAMACELEHERFRETRVTIELKPDGKEVQCDQERITRISDYLGRFPTVVFSSQDLQLVRGAPGLRRRWLDLTLAATSGEYLRVLQTFTRALAERNALLKSGRGAAAEFEAFEQTLAPAATALVEMRSSALAELGAMLAAAYAKLSDAAEPGTMSYTPNFAGMVPGAYLAKLAAGRARDAQFRTTLAGPHRDDFNLTLGGRPAKDFGSEGQQRSLVLALLLAQAAWYQQKSGIRPVLLADDVLGELDTARRRRFWAAIDPDSQVLATGTELPDAELGTWQVYEVREGTFRSEDAL